MKVNEILNESDEPLDDWHKLEAQLLKQKSWKPAKGTYRDGYGSVFTAVKLIHGLMVFYDPDYGVTIAGTGGHNEAVDSFEDVKKHVETAKKITKSINSREIHPNPKDVWK